MRFLSNAPFERVSLAMYPSDHFFLKALFLRGPSAGSGGLRSFQAQGCVAKEPFESSNLLAMDFSRAGVVDALEGVFRARVQCRQDGHKFVCPGPCVRAKFRSNSNRTFSPRLQGILFTILPIPLGRRQCGVINLMARSSHFCVFCRSPRHGIVAVPSRSAAQALRAARSALQFSRPGSPS